MHPEFTIIAARQHIADLHRAADHYRLLHAAAAATSSHVVPAPRHAAAAALFSFLDRSGSRKKGYRIRPRVNEEREVAPLAESAEDAKERAEADLSGAEYNEIQDEWPPQSVSVEAIAIASYPDLE